MNPSDFFARIIEYLVNQVPFIKENPALAGGFLAGVLIALLTVIFILWHIIHRMNKQAIVLPKVIEDKILAILPTTGKEVLRDSLVEAVVKNALQSAYGKARYHESVLKLLKAFHDVDQRLSPAIEIIAAQRITDIVSELSHLQNDNTPFHVLGSAQIDISKAFAFRATSVTFFEPALYKDIKNGWTMAFRKYLDDLKKYSTIKKELYIAWDVEANGNYNSTPELESLKNIMTGYGFGVFLVPRRALVDVGIVNLTWRLEIFNKEIALKVVHKDKYVEGDILDITLSTVDKDTHVKRALEIFAEHPISV